MHRMKRWGVAIGLPVMLAVVAASAPFAARAARGDEAPPAPTTRPATTTAPAGVATADVAEFRRLETLITARAPMCLPATQPAAAVTAGGIGSEAVLAAIDALRAHLAHVEFVASDANGLAVDFSAVAHTLTEADVPGLLRPLAPWLEAVSFRRCPVGDTTATFLAGAPRLTRLDLSGTRVTDAGLLRLSRLRRLEELTLVRAQLTDASVEALATMPALKNVYLWKSGLSSAGVARLRQRRPELKVDAGDSPVATTREAEPPFKLTSEAPPPQPTTQTAVKP